MYLMIIFEINFNFWTFYIIDYYVGNLYHRIASETHN